MTVEIPIIIVGTIIIGIVVITLFSLLIFDTIQDVSEEMKKIRIEEGEDIK